MENYRDRNQGQNNYDYPAWDVPEDGEYSDVDSFDEPDYDEPDYQGGYPSQGGSSVYGQGMPYPDNLSMRRGEAMNNRDMRRNPMRQDARPRRNTASGENMGFRRVLNERENIPGRRMPYSGQEVRELHGAQGVQAARENSGYAPVRESIPHENIVRDSASEEASISKLDKFIEDETKKAHENGKEFNFPYVTLHKLRHLNISALLANGEYQTDVQANAGHSNVNTTIHYTHTYTQGKEEIANKVEEIYSPLLKIAQ